MPYFLNQRELYDIISRELPDGLYAYSPHPGQFYITAEIDSIAFTLVSCYTAMKVIYDNFFILTADEKISQFEEMYLGAPTTGDLTLAERRANIIARIRSSAFVSMWEILTFLVSYVPEGTYVQILEYGNADGYGDATNVVDTWSVDHAQIDSNTYLAYENPQQLQGVDADLVWGKGWVYLDPLPDGVTGNDALTQTEMLYMRATAYSFEIRIFDYTFEAEALQRILKQLDKIIPVRSAYLITQNESLAAHFLTVDVANVDQFSNVRCICADPLQSTGYKGKISS